MIETYDGTLYKASINGATQINYTENTSIRAYIVVRAGITVSNVVFKPMLIKGTEEKPYQQYGAMPSTKYPSQIQNCGDNVNLFDKNNANTINAYISSSNVITADGSSESIYIKCKANTTYTISKKADKFFMAAYTENIPAVGGSCLGRTANSTNSRITITTSKKAKYLIVRYHHSTNTYSKEEALASLKIEEGAKATPYSKFEQGNTNFTICNKNLFNNKFEDYKRPENYLVCPIKLKQGKKYQFFGELKGSAVTGFAVGIVKDGDRYSNFNGLVQLLQTNGAIINKNFIVDETYTNPKLAVYVGDSNVNGTLLETNFNLIFENYNIQLEEGEIGTEHEEHKEQNFTFPLVEGQRLYKDSYLADDGIHHKRETILLNGETTGFKIQGVQKYTNGLYYCYLTISKKSINGSVVFSSHFKSNGQIVKANNCYITGEGRTLVFVLEDQTITTAEQANEWLMQQKENGTPVMFEYELVEEEIEAYTEEQQIAYNKIKNTAKSYKGTTHIFCTDEISCEFEATYIKDFETYVKSLITSEVQANES